MAVDLEYLHSVEDFPGDPREHRRKLAQSVNRLIANMQMLQDLANGNETTATANAAAIATNVTNIAANAAAIAAIPSGTPAWTYTPVVDLTNGGANDQTTVNLTTALPSTVLEFEVLLRDVSTNTNAQPGIIQLGTGSGFVTSTYVNEGIVIIAGSTAETAFTNGFHLSRDANIALGDVYNGVARFRRWDDADDYWFMDSQGLNDSIEYFASSGYVDLSEALTSVRIITNNATALLDGGQGRVRYR